MELSEAKRQAKVLQSVANVTAVRKSDMFKDKDKVAKDKVAKDKVHWKAWSREGDVQLALCLSMLLLLNMR